MMLTARDTLSMGVLKIADPWNPPACISFHRLHMIKNRCFVDGMGCISKVQKMHLTCGLFNH